MVTGMFALATVLLLLLLGLGAAQTNDGRPADLAATETSPNDLSLLSDEELLAELERRKAELALLPKSL